MKGVMEMQRTLEQKLQTLEEHTTALEALVVVDDDGDDDGKDDTITSHFDYVTNKTTGD